MVASQLANVYSWHKYYLHISITTSDKPNDYRHAVSTLPVELEQEGRPSMATPSHINPASTFVPALNLQYMLY